MRFWLELRTALILSRVGTVSAAAKSVGVHRATITRHIDTLEAEFGVRLFQRHARGFSVTDEGQEILVIAEQADAMFSKLRNRQNLEAQAATGTLIIAIVREMTPTVIAEVREFQKRNEHIRVEVIAESDFPALETGEAHIAFRFGKKPTHPDYVVLPFRTLQFGLYASRAYVERFGMPLLDDLEKHRFVAPTEAAQCPPYSAWLTNHVPDDAVRFRSNSPSVRKAAIQNGMGIGFIDSQEELSQQDVVEIMRPSEALTLDIWIVTHVDLHRSQKVQAFLAQLRG